MASPRSSSRRHMVRWFPTSACLLLVLLASATARSQSTATARPDLTIRDRLEQYATVTLTADLSELTEKEKEMLELLIAAAREMDEAFWIQAYGDKQELFHRCPGRFEYNYARINYGPWDRLRDNEPFLTGVGPKPAGANFYPVDMTRSEFEAFLAADPSKAVSLKHLYTMVRRGPDGKTLTAIPYHAFFREQCMAASRLLLRASRLAANDGLKRYLELRAKALLSDDYRASDVAWLDMKENRLDIVIGPIETYEDRLFGYKAAYEAFVLIKDTAWNQRLADIAALLPKLQTELPVDDAYKREKPGAASDLGAYDVVYYAGDCNAGAKTIAINLPNDESVQLEKGSRRLQLRNAMRAKYDEILLPIAMTLIIPEQRKHITFNAFFDNTMFHEVAHGLGVKNTINGKGTVRLALKDMASALEEGKADVLGLYLITKLSEQGRIHESNVKNSFVTFLAGMFRSIRFGASSAHGRANMLRFNYFQEAGAFTRDGESGMYRVDFDKMQEAIRSMSRKILTIQGDGDYDGAKALAQRLGEMGPVLRSDLERLAGKGIPVDIVFNQGLDVLQE